MATNFKTGRCYHCGADIGVHQFETNKCPYGGVEQPAHGISKEIWMDSVFEDSGERRLHDAAPAMYEALNAAYAALQECVPFPHHPDPGAIEDIKAQIREALAAANPETINT